MTSSLNILHVEDDQSDAILIEKILKSSPAPICKNVTNVSKLSDALKELQEQTFNVVLLDLNLVDVSGLDNLRCIKEENPNIPIIVMTGHADEHLAKKALSQGAQEFLFKGQGSKDILRRVITSSIIRKSAENDLYEQLHYDYLTQIPNRVFFKKMTEMLISRAERRKVIESLLFIDLDGFKAVNDTYGHEAGNNILIETAQRMRSVLRKSDVIARYAGDEFTIYLDGKQTGMTKDDCINITEKLIHAIEQPIDYQGNNITISASIGIAMFPDNGVDYASLIEAADQAMYRAKNDVLKRYCFADMLSNQANTNQSAH